MGPSTVAEGIAPSAIFIHKKMAKVLDASAIIFRLTALLAFHPHLALFGTVPEMVGVVVRGCCPTFRAFETVAFAVTARAMV